MSTYLVAFVVGKLETTETVDVDGVPLRVVCTPGKAAPRPSSPSRSARSRCASSPSTSTSPTPATRSTSSPSRTSPPARWRTWAASPSATPPCSSTRTRRPAPSSSGWPTSSRTSWPTCGSATSSPWAGGRASGSTRPSPPSWRCSASTPSGPSWDRWVGFAPSREAALAVDAVHSTRPIEYPVGPPKEAEGMFDLLTYEKGCGVLRMLEQHIGAEVFRDGVRTYLKAHAYGNTVTTRSVGRARGRQRRARARRHGHVHPPGRAPARLAARRRAQPAALLARAGARRRRRRPSGPSGSVPVAVRALPAAGRPGAPVRHLVLDADPSRSPRPTQGLAVVNAGGWGMFRVGYETRAPAGAGRAPARADPARAGQPAGRHLGHHPGRALDARASSWSWRRGSGSSPTRRRGPPSAARWSWPTGSRRPSSEDALHQRRRAR